MRRRRITQLIHGHFHICRLIEELELLVTVEGEVMNSWPGLDLLYL
jgi:hypothetical protein